MSDKRILNIIEFLEAGPADRRAIAEHIGLGVTVTGDILREMLGNKVIRKYEKTGSVGRRSAIYTLTDNPVFAVMNLSGEKISSSLFGYSLKSITSVTTDIDDPLFFDDSVTDHLRILRDAAPCLIACAVVAEGTVEGKCFSNAYPRQLSGLPLQDIFAIYFPNTVVMLESSPLWNLPERERFSAYLSDNDSSLRLSLLYGDSVLSVGGVGRSIGDVTDSLGRSLSSAVKFARNAEEYATAMAHAVETVLSFSSPATLCISQKRYRASREIIRRIEEKLISDYGFDLIELPEIVAPSEYDTVSSSLVKHIRRRVIEEGRFN